MAGLSRFAVFMRGENDSLKDCLARGVWCIPMLSATVADAAPLRRGTNPVAALSARWTRAGLSQHDNLYRQLQDARRGLVRSILQVHFFRRIAKMQDQWSLQFHGFRRPASR